MEKLFGSSLLEPVAVTLALLQLENFYEIRTWVGKSEANLLLSDIAQMLTKSLPPNALVCRCPHYEFALLLTNECSLNAKKITEKLKLELQSVASSTIPPQLELHCGVGLAAIDDLTHSADVLLARARHNLSQYYYMYDFDAPDPFPVSLDSETVVSGIRTGLEEDSFRLSFQPIVSLKEDDLQYYEVRCAAPESHGIINSSAMFEYAVLNAYGEQIDRWVIRQALRLLQFKRQGNLRLTINLSQNSLVSTDFFSWLQEELKEFPCLQEQLMFQLSEIDVLISQHHMSYFCQQLEALQIQLCISHFGCTTNPFRYLPLVQAQRVKLDVSLLEKINDSAIRRKKLADTVAKLHEHGLRVTAGMVEQMIYLPTLWRAKINFVQGNCFQPPSGQMDFEFSKSTSYSIH